MEVPSAMQGIDEILKELLTADQHAEYAGAKADQRQAQAEEYAHRKVRKLNNDLYLSGEEKDELFQAFAQQFLEVPAPGQNPGDCIIDRRAVESILTPEQEGIIIRTRLMVSQATGNRGRKND